MHAFSLGKKLNVMLVTIFLVGGIGNWVLISWIAGVQSEREISDNARMLLKATEGVRSYTSRNLNAHLLAEQERNGTFLAETVPSFSARSVFENFRKTGYEDYFYKEASTNPTNLRDDKADAFEEGIINAFRSNTGNNLINGYREDFGGSKRFFTAVAMRLTDATCLRCHSTPDVAPKAMVAKYGPQNGFGWKMNDVIATRIIYVPAGKVQALGQRNALITTSLFLGTFAVAVGAINLLMRRGVIRPINQLAAATEVISKPAGSSLDDDGPLAQQFALTEAGKALQKTRGRGDEIGKLAERFMVMADDVKSRELSLRQAKTAIASREAFFRAIIENASVTYVILDAFHMIRYASPLVRGVLGAEPQELQGKMIVNAVPEDAQRRVLDAVERAERGRGTGDPFEFRRVDRDGTVRWVEAVVTNMLNEPVVKGLVIVVRDITDRKTRDAVARPSSSDSVSGSPALPVRVEAVPTDPVALAERLAELLPKADDVVRQAAVLRLVAAGIGAGAGDAAALPAHAVQALRARFNLREGEPIDPARLLDLLMLLAEFAVALDTLVWGVWKNMAPKSEVRRTTGPSAGAATPSLTKTWGRYVLAEGTVPRGQVSYDLERTRALIASLLASLGQVGQQFVKQVQAKFAPAEIERIAATQSRGALSALGNKDAAAWRAYKQLIEHLNAAQTEAEMLEGLAAYAESLMKGLR